ncbi:phosphoadenosine phosphosulfate reductase family protein (plasmid) [Paenibacillus sonchi]|uniref:Phosphoadenosine phosphosulfate reductase family protein n=1 Tax=Paenibacillus sonchi TaxID=373687 RepID=A0A974PJ08_9BACL|nr:phosphoadenosine phosphosulfate reductase family protein [Paenibacillus sonchi]QQZ64595.1 phosphoadenosine phosphosulfate reductase family protein [Paenibacillus sonchi]
MNIIVFFSGGKASFASAVDAKLRFPEANIILYFTDTLWENEDLYRFIHEASDKLELPLLIHSSGLTPIQVMFEEKLVYNSMIGRCSTILKQKVSQDFIRRGIRPKIEKWRNKQYLKNENFTFDPTLYFGIGFEEMHRAPAIQKNWAPFKVEMPLIERNIWKDEVIKRYNIRQPKLYDLGFSHNNCNGRCVKAGQAHYRLLREAMPAVFAKLVEQEFHLKMCVSAYRYITKGNNPKDKNPIPLEDVIPLEVQKKMLTELDEAYRDYFYDRASKPKLFIHPAASASSEYMKLKQYSFMKRDGAPLSLRDFQIELDSDSQVDLFDFGGCGCFTDPLCEDEISCGIGQYS